MAFQWPTVGLCPTGRDGIGKPRREHKKHPVSQELGLWRRRLPWSVDDTYGQRPVGSEIGGGRWESGEEAAGSAFVRCFLIRELGGKTAHQTAMFWFVVIF